jgi:hypothetical protein
MAPVTSTKNPLKRSPDKDFFLAPAAQRAKRSERVDYAALEAGSTSQPTFNATPFSSSSSCATSSPIPNTSDDEVENSITVEVPPGHEDFEDPTAAGIEELAEPEFGGLSLHNRKIAIQAWFASRQKVESPTRGKSSHVRSLSNPLLVY